MKKLYIALIIIAVVFLVTGLLIRQAVYQKAGKDTKFIVQEGDGTREIGAELKKEKLIFSSAFFSYYIYQKHILLQPGVYKITKNMKVLDIISLLHAGKVEQNVVTIPEGWRLTQIDELLSQKKIIKKGELIKIASADEGYLFPDTYFLPLDITPSEIRSLMIDNFNKKTADLKISKQDIIIASIVEREAKFDEDRAKIAGVYLSRLDIDMNLEADPTVQYAKGSWDSITLADYRNVQSKYNTYLYAGLPPGPICNPGIKSIEAALNPEKDGSLYFFHKSDGHAVYAKTLKEHQANVEKYR